MVVDWIGDNLPQSTEKSRIIVIPVGARHKCQQAPSSDSEQEEVHCLMANQPSYYEVFDFSNTEFTREDLINALNEMVHEYRNLSQTFEEVKAENMDLKNSSVEPSTVQLGETDSLQIELNKLKNENESLRLRSCELESENKRLNLAFDKHSLVAADSNSTSRLLRRRLTCTKKASEPRGSASKLKGQLTLSSAAHPSHKNRLLSKP
ncbi:hypothetical protein F511_39914 [Dorcoceras hygrometricum]|uniref:Uncharacterized protein n=1 Tax=Dorcoceras hygrometricum TaxID=472368 RepID=A0A2Z7C628_9LAMI|nr:hypothetical protein F511_39914 [Dorcoceras hygrometricum]